MFRPLYNHDYYEDLRLNQGLYDYDNDGEEQLNNVRNVRDASIRLISQYQAHCNGVIEKVEKIIEEEVLSHLLKLALIQYRCEECEVEQKIIKEIYGDFCGVLLYRGIYRSNDVEPFLYDFREKILDIREKTDRKVKLMFNVHNVTCASFFFK